MKLAAVGALAVPTMALVMAAAAIATQGRARVDLQPGRARLHRDALRLHVAVEQQRQRLRRLRRDDVLDDARHRRALLRPLLPAARRARDRRLARREEGRPRLGRDVPHRRRHLRGHAARGHRAHGGADDPAGPDARPDRGRADALMLRALLASVVAIVVFTVVLGFGYPALMTGVAQVDDVAPGEREPDRAERDGRRLRRSPRRRSRRPRLLPRAAVGDVAALQPGLHDLLEPRPDEPGAREAREAERRRRSSSSRARTTRA